MHPKKLGIAAAMAATLSAPVIAEDKVVNVYNWYDYVDAAVLEQFQQETGIKLNYDVYDSNEQLEAKLMAGGSGYDVVVPTGNFLERQVKAGIYMELDRSKLSNYGNLDPVLAKTISGHDPDNKHNVPWAWGTIGVGVNVDMVKERMGDDAPVDSLDLVFKAEYASKLADCGIGVVDSPSEVMGVALHYLGLDPNSEKKSDLKQATEMLSAVRPHFKHFNTANMINDLASGELCAVLTYNGDVGTAAARAEEVGSGVNLSYSIPKEGTLAWFDLMAVPADAPNADEAHQFINFMLRPESAAGIANYVYFAVANKAAEPLLLDDVKNDPGIYPPQDVLDKLFVLNAHTAKYDRVLTRAWTNFKTGR